MKLSAKEMNYEGRETPPWVIEIIAIANVAVNIKRKSVCKKRQN